MSFLNFGVQVITIFVARHVVEEEKDVKRAMEFLHDCELLKIEDILPFFPDFVTIDHFKVIRLTRRFSLCYLI
jgi:hypothetical protein